MAKRGKLIVLFLITAIIFLALSVHQSSAAITQAGQIEKTGQQIENIGNTLTNEQSRTDYLKNQWADIIANTTFGRGVTQVGNFLTILNPLFKLVPGVPFSWSGNFFLAIILFLLILDSIQGPIYMLTIKKPIIMGGAIVISIILSLTGLIRWIAELLSSLILKIDNLFIQIIAWVVLIVLSVFLFILNSKFRYSLYQEKEAEELRRTKGEAKTAKIEAEAALGELEEIEEELQAKETGKKKGKEGEEEETIEEKIVNRVKKAREIIENIRIKQELGLLSGEEANKKRKDLLRAIRENKSIDDIENEEESEE